MRTLGELKLKQFSKDELLQRIANYLIINGSFTSSLGLYHGKMGIVLFFAHYARYTGNLLYDDFAGELLEEILEEIHTGIPVNFENGLCGIGWGVEYLVQNKFMEGDTAEILEDIDQRIMVLDPLQMKDISLKTGLAGIGYYVSTHVYDMQDNRTALDKDYLWNLMNVLSKADFRKDESRHESTGFPITFPDFLFENIVLIGKEAGFSGFPLGIENGIAGAGLKLMLT
jgi:lantibiotic modifying enzyme